MMKLTIPLAVVITGLLLWGMGLGRGGSRGPASPAKADVAPPTTDAGSAKQPGTLAGPRPGGAAAATARYRVLSVEDVKGRGLAKTQAALDGWTLMREAWGKFVDEAKPTDEQLQAIYQAVADYNASLTELERAQADLLRDRVEAHVKGRDQDEAQLSADSREMMKAERDELIQSTIMRAARDVLTEQQLAIFEEHMGGSTFWWSSRIPLVVPTTPAQP